MFTVGGGGFGAVVLVDVDDVVLDDVLLVEVVFGRVVDAAASDEASVVAGAGAAAGEVPPLDVHATNDRARPMQSTGTADIVRRRDEGA